MTEPITLCWPNGGMGHAIYTLMCVGTVEIGQDIKITDLPTNGSDWHDVSKTIKTPKVIKHHPGYVENSIAIGTPNTYLLVSLSWGKWAGYPVINNAEDLESVVLWLNDYEVNVPVVDFDIERLFEDDAYKYAYMFIENLGLTPNENFYEIINSIVQNNIMYYNKIKYLEFIRNCFLNNKNVTISKLKKHEHAMLMSMIYKETGVPFKLVNDNFTSVQDIYSVMEN